MSGALVLNASLEPLSVVNARRAVVLIIRGRALLVEARSEIWHAERTEMAVPSVVRLTNYVRVAHHHAAPVTRRAVFGRDGFRCQYCEATAESIDHVVPRSRGGQHVVACCRRCNARKGDRLPEEAGFSLVRRPSAPAHHTWVYASSGFALDPTWHRYLMLEPAS
jgi:5-methylcytosine-specific restriction endonuclease McrA